MYIFGADTAWEAVILLEINFAQIVITAKGVTSFSWPRSRPYSITKSSYVTTSATKNGFGLLTGNLEGNLDKCINKIEWVLYQYYFHKGNRLKKLKFRFQASHVITGRFSVDFSYLDLG